MRRAAIAGALNAVVTGFGALYATRFLGPRPEHPTLSELVSYWSVFGVLAAVFAVAEIAYLYWDALQAVRELSSVAGLELGANENGDVARALARAALELPNPVDASFGVNPGREASKLQLGVASLVYKLKISASNFVFKALVTRAFGRFLTRSLLAFTAIPINAGWNALVCWAVLREARIRVMGPSAAVELVDAAFDVEPEPSAELLRVVHQALGSAVVRTSEFHPNHVALMRAFRARFGAPDPGLVLDEPARFLVGLAALAEPERRTAIRVLAVAAVLDGRLVRKEKKLLSLAYESAGLEPRLDRVEALRRAFVAGDVVKHATLREIA
ncbi:MAG TPA: hypothetical protein VHC69_18410 [Polyangiaceae bacterium]|nr:hypothetical protein [Polyangiaceae bacterium]